MPPKRVYIAENLANQLGKLYPHKEEGLNRAVYGFLALRDVSLRALRQRFTRQELVGLLDTFNGTYLDLPHILSPRDMLRREMEDAEALENKSHWHGYDAAALQTKIGELSDQDAYFLLDELGRFWSVNSTTEGNLDKFLALYGAQ